MESRTKSIERPKSLTELVTAELRSWIVNGELDLGEHISEARVAKSLEVSRTPVREAMNRLEMEGLLVVSPQRGSVVFSLKPEELSDLCDARVCLEQAALETSLVRDRTGLGNRLSRIVDQMTGALEAGDITRYLTLDTEFHLQFFEAAQNRFLAEAHATIAPKMSALRNRLGRHPDHLEKSYREHRQIAAMVEDAPLSEILTVLKAHIDRKEGSYWHVATRTASVET